MSFYLFVVIASLIFSWGLNLYLETKNLGFLSTDLPQEFITAYSPDAYAKSQEYTRVQAKFGMLTSTFDLIVLLVCIFLGGFDLLDGYLRGFGCSSLATGLMYFAVLGVVGELLGLPFALYQTFVLEERFGFNTTTMGTFWLDRIKGYALTCILGGALLSGVLWFFAYAGTYAWIVCWFFTSFFLLTLQYLAPRWIMPLFNTFTPLKPGETRDAIMSFARKVGFSLEGIFVMDGSKRSAKSNAFFTGFGKKKRIALFDTLLEEQTTGELVAILAHEIGHYMHKHILKGLVVGIIKTGCIFLFLGLLIRSTQIYAAFDITQPSIYTGLVIFALLYTPFSLILSPLGAYISRKHEFQADAFAACTLENPHDMVSALKKLSVNNLSNLTPHPWYVAFHYSHPPVLERIRAIEKNIALSKNKPKDQKDTP